MTDEELDALVVDGSRHVETAPTIWKDHLPNQCVHCGQRWPCDARRLLAAVEALRAERDDCRKRFKNRGSEERRAADRAAALIRNSRSRRWR